MKYAVLLVIAAALPHAALAQPSPCPQHFADGEAPEFINQKLAAKTVPLCFAGFAVMHSAISRTPLWSAEHLTAERVAQTKRIKRNNTFHAEPRLPPGERAELRDYARSGFDRGHMSPAGDMPDRTSQYDSFSLANMVPQDPHNNQTLWSGIEEVTRKFATYRGELYVITGPIFEGSALERLNMRVLVPTHLFKAIYDPAGNAAAAYLAPNRSNATYEAVSIAELERRTGIRLFPNMPAKIKEIKMRLPEPKKRGGQSR
jgi:endonuclease G